MDSSFTYITVIVIVLKFFKILSGKNKQIKFPGLWLIPALFIMMTFQDSSKASGLTAFSVFVIAGFFIIGLLVGAIRGKTLKYNRDENGIYYQESYQSLALYILLIVLKWVIRQFGVGQIAALISLSMLFFACGSMVGRGLYLSVKYLSFQKEQF